jgi:hypothetical protein
MVERQETWSPAGRCGLIAIDVVGFGGLRKNRQVQKHVRSSLYKIVATALGKSGVEFGGCYSEDRGDGLLVAVPPDVPTERLIHPCVEYLRAGVRLHNLLSSDVAQLRLRVAVHGAETWTDEHGLVGDGVVHLFRLLDAPEFKRVIQQTHAYVALIASEAVYDEVIWHAPDLIDPDDYASVGIKHKELSGVGWVRLVGRASSVSQFV